MKHSELAAALSPYRNADDTINMNALADNLGITDWVALAFSGGGEPRAQELLDAAQYHNGCMAHERANKQAPRRMSRLWSLVLMVLAGLSGLVGTLVPLVIL